MKIIVDAMGGDNAPLAPVEGALRAAEDLGVEIILTGPEAVIRDCLTKLGKTDLPQGVENPRVALLNIGAEESKGLELQKQTYALLTEAKRAGRIHFVGNIEGREAITQGVDVLVTDGYTGNIFLKTMEGAAALFSGALKEMLLASTKNKVAALMLKNSIGDFKKRFDSSEVGGTALLGISQPVVKAHGSSNAYAFYNAIRQAKTVAEADIVGDIAANVEHMRWERPKPAEKQEEG